MLQQTSRIGIRVNNLLHSCGFRKLPTPQPGYLDSTQIWVMSREGQSWNVQIGNDGWVIIEDVTENVFLFGDNSENSWLVFCDELENHCLGLIA